MAYEKWGTKQYEKTKGLKGQAAVRVTATTIRIAFKDDPENIYEVPVTNATGVVKNGTWWVSLSAKGDKLYGISPIQGAYPLRFKEIAHAQNQPPTPASYTSHWKDNNGKEMESQYEAFTLLFEITEGPCAGMTAGKFLRYYFAASTDGMVLFDKPRSPHTKVLADTMDTLGAFDRGTMKYTENILPALQARMQAANYPLMGIFKEGNIESLTRIDAIQSGTEEAVEPIDRVPGSQPEEAPQKPKKTAEEIIDEIAPNQ